MGLFTKRNAPPPTQLRYDLPDHVLLLAKLAGMG